MIGPNVDIFSGQTIAEPNNLKNDQDQQFQTRSIRNMKMIRLRRSHHEPVLDKKEFPMIRLRRNYLDYDYEN